MLEAAAGRQASQPLRAALDWLAARRALLAWGIGTRVLVIGCSVLVHALGWPRGYFPPSVLRSPLGVLGAWDGHWYRLVAAHGYLFVPGRQSDPAFFPLFPMLLRALRAAGLPMVSAGVIFANLTFLVGLLAFYELSRLVVGEADARRASVYAAVIPIGFVFSMEYPTGLVFALLALAGVLALRQRWLATAACAAAATLARPEGLFFALPLAGIALRRWPAADANERAGSIAAVLAAPAALLAYPIYLDLALHDPFAWSESQRAWGRNFQLDGVVKAFTTLPRGLEQHPWVARDLLFFVAYAVLLVVARRVRIGTAWIAAAGLTVLLPLASGSVESDARFGLLAFALYWALARLVQRPAAEWALRALCVGLLCWWTIALPLANP